MRTDDPLEAMQAAAWHLRMQLAGKSSYSGTPSKIDKGWAELLLERLEQGGFQVVAKAPEDRFGLQDAIAKTNARVTERWAAE